MFQKMKDMYALQKQAKAIKKELASIHVEAEVNGVVAVVSAEQEVISVTLPDNLCSPAEKAKLSASIIEAIKKAMKKAQQIAAEKMKGVMGDMGFGM